MSKLKELYNWLELQWRKGNHSKYQHYFKKWVTNLTTHQLEGFNKQRLMNYETNRRNN